MFGQAGLKPSPCWCWAGYDPVILKSGRAWTCHSLTMNTPKIITDWRKIKLKIMSHNQWLFTSISIPIDGEEDAQIQQWRSHSQIQPTALPKGPQVQTQEMKTAKVPVHVWLEGDAPCDSSHPPSMSCSLNGYHLFWVDYGDFVV